jgi:hypothetical protein
VSRLVDVRLTPISRKRGFGKTALRTALAEAGIAYDHRRERIPQDGRQGLGSVGRVSPMARPAAPSHRRQGTSRWARRDPVAPAVPGLRHLAREWCAAVERRTDVEIARPKHPVRPIPCRFVVQRHRSDARRVASNCTLTTTSGADADTGSGGTPQFTVHLFVEIRLTSVDVSEMMNSHKSSGGEVMTDMWVRGTGRRYISAAIAAVCSPHDRRKPASWQEREQLTCVGSPP